jgi:hypothetical protein
MEAARIAVVPAARTFA